MSQPVQQNKMGVMPVHRLLISMALPMIISMLVQAMYNIVDSIYVAQINEEALSAVTVAFPIQNLMIAVGAGTGVGINALLSRSLGEGNYKEASRAANNGIFLAFLSFLAFLVFGLLATPFYVSTQTDNPVVADYATQYLQLCCGLSFGIFGQFVFERLLQATGKTFYTMITQGVGAVINIVLDPLFIFGGLGIPAMGVAGAAIATVFGQCVAMLMAILFNLRVNKEIHLSLRGFRPNGRTIRKIYAVGVPSIIMGSIASVMTFFFNIILRSMGPLGADSGIPVFGTYFKLQSFIFMPVFGLNNGMVPIVAFNYGARKPDRIMKTIRISITYAMSIMLVGLLIFQLVPELLLTPFNLTAQTTAVAVPALRTISWSFVFAGFCIIITSVFQALSHGVLSLIVSVGRQLVVLVPVAYLLSLSDQINAVWWSFPIAELASLTLCIVFFIHLYRKEIRPLGTE